MVDCIVWLYSYVYRDGRHMSKYHRITKMYVHYCHIHIGMRGITNLLTRYSMNLILNNCGIVSPAL